MRVKAEFEIFLPRDASGLREMLSYHMGWENGSSIQGKRLRPIIVLLSAMAVKGSWNQALPAATAVEYLHNFSLIHDDIQDRSEYRHNRQTVWVKWGVAQAINAGDTLFTLAHLAMLDSRRFLSGERTLQACVCLDKACVELTKGQYLDLLYEKISSLPLDAYWSMVSGKTAALLGCSSELGAIAGGAKDTKRIFFREFGYNLGLAFQVQDDMLGIWGDTELTGKSSKSDLTEGKKSLPVLYSLSLRREFAERWSKGSIRPEEVQVLSDLLVEDGTRAFIEKTSSQYIDLALCALDKIDGDKEALLALKNLTTDLLQRKA